MHILLHFVDRFHRSRSYKKPKLLSRYVFLKVLLSTAQSLNLKLHSRLSRQSPKSQCNILMYI